MTNVTLGDLAQAHVLRRESAALKSQVRVLTAEVTTGRAADTARAVSGDLVPLAAITTSLMRAGGFRAATAEAGLFLQGMQSVLERVDSIAQDLSSTLLTTANSGHATMLSAVSAEATSRFDAAVSALNTRLGDRTLFAGMQTGGPALVPSSVMLDDIAAAAAAAGASTAAEVDAAVRAWFDAPGGFAAQGYRGGAAPAALPVSPEDDVAIDVTADDPTLRDTLAGLAMAALLDRGFPSGLHAERIDLARRAGETILSAQTDRAALAGRIGTAQARVESALQRNATEVSALEIARAEILAVDQYAAATRLEATQTQLETLHAVTARLARLSLVDFLR
jgi:flagellar hook-associated protein 3 FlgL